MIVTKENAGEVLGAVLAVVDTCGMQAEVTGLMVKALGTGEGHESDLAALGFSKSSKGFWWRRFDATQGAARSEAA